MPQNHFNICSDPILKEHLVKQGIQAQVFDSVLTCAAKTKMLEDLEQFASSWFLTQAGIDCTDYRNVSLGAALHDEIRTFFQLLFHFAYILNTLGKNVNIVFYHSTSCLMPDVVIKFLMSCNARIELIDLKYPWLSFKEQHASQIKRNFSRITFSHTQTTSWDINDFLGQIKLALKQRISKLFLKIFKKTGRTLYLHAFRSLMPFYEQRLNDAKSSYTLYITDNTPLVPGADIKNLGFFRDIRQLFRLARKGIALDSLRCPFYYKWYRPYGNKTEYRKLHDAFCLYRPAIGPSQMGEKDNPASAFLSEQLRIFYLEHLAEFMKLIDFYYDKFKKLKIDLCLQEMCHPFQAQVMANLEIPCRIYPSNHILHNQYFAPSFFEKVKKYFQPIATSALDVTRFIGLGFSRENIKAASPTLLAQLCLKISPVHRINNLVGKKFLVLAPSIVTLDSFRYQVQSERLYVFFQELFEVFAELKISDVTIRPHPGANVPRNQFGFTDNDIFRYLIDSLPPGNKTFRINFSNSYFHNMQQDIEASDLVIANISGSLFEVLLRGRDYVCFDDTITPYYGTNDWTAFNEGTIIKLSTKEELRIHLQNYQTPGIESLRSKLYGSSQSSGNEVADPDPFLLL